MPSPTLNNPAVESISAFFPCYNDAEVIGDLVATTTLALEKLDVDFEVIVVDDGSEDDSLAVLKALENDFPRLVVVEHGDNRGYGGALKTGFETASKQWVFYTDGDGQYDPAELTTLVDAASDDVDFVQGFKLSRGDNIARVLIGRTYHHTVKFFFDLEVRDTDCDFRLIRRSLLDSVDLAHNSGVICVEMMRAFRDRNARFVEVPVHHYPRPVGRSQFFKPARVAQALSDLGTLWVDQVYRGQGR